MIVCLAHVQDDSGSQCSGRRASHAKGAGRRSRDVSFGFPFGGDAPPSRAAHGRGTAGTLAPPLADCKPPIRGRSRAPRAGCTMIVLDASAAIEWLFQSPAGMKIDRRMFVPSESLHAPHLIDVEVAQEIGRA